MNRATRFVTGTALALALVAGSVAQAGPLASPAAANERYDHDGRRGGGANVGAILLGAAVIGGIAAIASSNSRRDRDHDRYGYDPSVNGYGGQYAQDGYVQNGDQYGYGQGGYQNGYAGQNAYGYQNGYGQNGYEYQGGAGYAQGARDAVAICTNAAQDAARDYGRGNRVSQIYRVEAQRGGARVIGGIDGGGRWNGGYQSDRQTRFDCTARYGRVTELRLR
jgi:hypothetical protein